MARATSPRSTRSSSRGSGGPERRKGKMSQVIESEDEDSVDDDDDDEADGDADAASQRSDSEDDIDSRADDNSDAGSTRSRAGRGKKSAGEESKENDKEETQNENGGASTPPPPASEGSEPLEFQAAAWGPYIEPQFGLVDGHVGEIRDGVDFDVVLVHGLHGEKNTTWNDEEFSWQKSLIKEDLFGYWSIRELSFWYDKSWSLTSIYDPEGINQEAQKLLDDLVELRKDIADQENPRPIVFIGHDIGGIIVKKALVLAASNATKYGNIPWETSTLVFLSVPNRTTEMERLEDALIDLISMDKTVPGLVRKASQLARNIKKVNAEFVDTNMLLRASIFSVFCSFDPMLSDEDRDRSWPIPFDRFTCVFETPFEYCCKTLRSHKDMTRKPSKGDSDWPLAIKRVINELPYYTNVNESLARVSKLFLSSTPPVYPYIGPDHHEELYSWFTDLEACSEWLESNRGLSIMHLHHDAEEDVIGTGASEAAAISQALFTIIYTHFTDHPAKGEHWVCYFRFNKSDNRYRDIKAMLITFLTTLVCRFTYDIGGVAEKMVEDWSRNVNASDLVDIFQAFMELRDNYTTEKVTFCVGCFDQCEEESRKWFLKELVRMGRLKESRDKWLFDSSDPDFLEGEQIPSGGLWRVKVEDSPMFRPPSPIYAAEEEVDVSALNAIPQTVETDETPVTNDVNAEADDSKIGDGEAGLDDAIPKSVDDGGTVKDESSETADNVHIEGTADTSEDPVLGDKAIAEGSLAPSEYRMPLLCPYLSIGFNRRLDDRPVLLNVEDDYRALVGQNDGQVTRPARAVLDWVFLKSEHATMATVEALVARPKSLDPDELFRSMLDFVNQETQSQAHRLVTLLRHTLRPLSSHEAAVALSVMGSPKATLTDAEVMGIIDPLLFNFPGVFKLSGQEIFVWPLFEPLSEEKDMAAHGAMAELCLEYLLQPDVQPLIDEHSDNVAKVAWVAFEPRHDFVSYAARHWLDHYRLAGTYAPKEPAYAFFANEKASRSWREAALSRMMLAFPLRHYLSPIPQIASTGLDDLLERRLEEDRNSATFAADCNLAFSEAASSNHSSTVELLFKRFDPSPQALKDAFDFAASDGCDAVLKILIDYASRGDNVKRVEWPDNLLSRLSWLGRHVHMRRLLDLGLSPDPKDSHTLEPIVPTPLSVALSGPHLEATKVLIDGKVDILTGDKKGVTPILVACQNGDPDLVRLLIEKGVDIEVKDENGVTPLQGATDWGRLQAVEVLLEHGADHTYGQVDNKEANSTTWKPLVQASENNYAKIAALLLAKGADADATGPKGCALYLAAKQGYVDICVMLLKHGASANVVATDFAPPLSVAVESGKLELVRLLLDHGANIEAVFKGAEDGDSMDTALTLAARDGSTEIVELLLQRGANPNHYEGDLDPPIYLASWRGHVEVVNMLLEKGADPNAQLDGQDWTAVHAAYDNPEAMRLLLAKGGDPDRVADSSTALLLAVRWDNLETLKAVLERVPKPNLEAEDDDQMTALCRACLSISDDAPEMIRALLDEGADPNHGAGTDRLPLHQCLYKEESLQALLESRPQLDAKDSQGDTALHLVTSLSRTDILRKLIVGGADIEAINNDGLTPLAKAVQRDFAEDAISCLLKKGAQPNFSAPGFAGILHEAMRTCELPTLKALVKAGADVNALSAITGASVLYQAAYFFRSNVVEVLEYLVEELQMQVNTYGGPYGWPLTVAAWASESAFEYLLEHGANPEVEDSMGRRPAHLAAVALQLGSPLSTLVARGVSFQTSDKMGLLPLHFAAHSGNVDQLRICLAQPGVSVNATDVDGWTPLMWACTARWNADEKIEFLLAQGADIWAQGAGWDKNWSPLRLSRFAGQDEWIHAKLQPDEASKDVGVEGGRVWDEDFHDIDKGDGADRECFACLSHMRGKRWRCISCHANTFVQLCFKCYRYKDMIHGQHEFKEEGFEFEKEALLNEDVAGENTPFGEHGGRSSRSGSDFDDSDTRPSRNNRRPSRSSNSGSYSDSSVGIEDEDSDEGLNEEESSGDEK
ncbi:hypothetical protein ACHAQH_006590 [Verticillium albo-atrum]